MTVTPRRQWVAMLAKLVCPMDAPVAAKALADMLPLLEDFPDTAFTIQSLDRVAVKVRRTPNYADLREALGECWRDQRRAVPDPAPGHPESKRVGQTDWDDAVKVRQSVRSVQALPDTPYRRALESLLAKAVSLRAPENLALIPPGWARDDADA